MPVDNRGVSPPDQPGAGEVELLDARGLVPTARDGRPAGPGGSSDARDGHPTVLGPAPPGRTGPAAWLVRAARPAGRQLALLTVYVAAGIALTWPRVAYLPRQAPTVRDVSSYIWDLWWIAHQVSHLGNPWFTASMAAPVGTQLGFDTTMPLVGLIMAPVTLAFSAATSFWLLTAMLPGLLCYVMYRLARLWLRPAGAFAAGALFGLSAMLDWQVWFHLNIAAGSLALPATLAAVIRLRRHPGPRQGVILGLILGATVLVNQESAVLAGLVTVAALVPWLVLRARVRPLVPLATGLLVAVAVASPQLIAMISQATAGGATVRPHSLAATYGVYGAGLPSLFGPSPQVSRAGLTALAAVYHYRQPGEGAPTFGLALTLLALTGLALSWRHRRAWVLAAGWLVSAALALGTTLQVGTRTYVPLAAAWHGTRVSLVLPYTWLVRVPGLSALREADRLALPGLMAAALLAGFAVDRLRDRSWPLAAAGLMAGLASLAVLEAGWSGAPHLTRMDTAYPQLDGPIAADHSGSVVVDVPFGLRGGIPLSGKPINARDLLLATADGHPRAISYLSWNPPPTAAAIFRHPFYARLQAAQRHHHSSPAQLAAARRDAQAMRIGWVIVWHRPPTTAQVRNYLVQVGFRLSYRADGAAVYRPGAPLPHQAARPR
jgi:hypothetical protein